MLICLEENKDYSDIKVEIFFQERYKNDNYKR